MTTTGKPQVYANHPKPRMLHWADCPHQEPGVSSFRDATPQELKQLRWCRDCANKR